ncbi:MAG: phenylalanine--tRNA ligase subunit beta [Alphaproteobacteria bacterium]|nr:phenylalanine--tRNA ligase subunit beta [Alphaproteobacteria bacterium]
MKLTLSSLKECLDTNASLKEICTKLTAIGLEVESVEDETLILAPFSVAKIIEAKPHENSTKLKICMVEVADSKVPLQIICGAANARMGLKVAYAPIGAVIPANQMVIKKAKIAGVESNGMLCSARELGIGGEDAGIIEIDEKWSVGTKITEVFGLNDALIEINVTPNRGDCLGVYGIARDLAASGIGELKNLQIKKTKSAFPFPYHLPLTTYHSCPFASFRTIRNLKNCESPKWLKDSLQAASMNSISAIVDVTNYVMHVLNRPMHAYDAAKIKAPIEIRFAREGEKFTSLKNETYELDEKILVVADSERILGVAGVIGSAVSCCDLNTTEILLESAFFTPSAIAYSGRKLNILSDARHRFERGVDEASCEQGIDLATQLILEICGGEASETILVGKQSEPKKIAFDFAKIKKLTSVETTPQKAKEVLEKLGFSGFPDVTIPSHRHDIFSSEDLVEEVVRILGYDQIKSQPLTTYHLSLITDRTRSVLASQGLTEIITWSFIDEKLVEVFGEKNPQLILQNPISSEMNHMRPSLVPGLITVYQKNSARGFADLSLFEIGNVFLGTAQKPMIAGLRAGLNKEQNHYHDERQLDVFDVKKDFFVVVENFGLRAESLQLSTSNTPKYYHPHRSASLALGKNLVGFFGELHPGVAKKLDIKTRVNIFEIFTDALPAQQKSGRKAYVQNDLPIVERDFAFLADVDLAVGDLIKTITNADKQLIREVSIFDIFSGNNIPVGKKSVALRVKIQPQEKTLTSDEIEVISKKIIDAVVRTGASLRV